MKAAEWVTAFVLRKPILSLLILSSCLCQSPTLGLSPSSSPPLFETLADKYRCSKTTNWLNDAVWSQKISTHHDAWRTLGVLGNPELNSPSPAEQEEAKRWNHKKVNWKSRTELPGTRTVGVNRAKVKFATFQPTVCIFNSCSRHFSEDWVVLVERGREFWSPGFPVARLQDVESSTMWWLCGPRRFSEAAHLEFVAFPLTPSFYCRFLFHSWHSTTPICPLTT